MIQSPSIASLPFQRIPRQPGLFLEYVRLSADALRFYRHPPSLDALALAAEEVRARVFPRLEMAEILHEQNKGFGGSASAQSAIEDLTRPDCVAVVTGQQTGLFTGPLLTIYKALTALRLSEGLRRRGLISVPIFWMASDDHDLAEVTRLTIPAQHNETSVLDARQRLFGTTDFPPRPVGPIALPPAITSILDEYTGAFWGTWRDSMRAQLVSACRPGTTFAEAFGRLMTQLLGPRGLVLFDPRDARAKRLAAPLIGEVLRGARSLRAQLMERTTMLENSGLAAQVAVQPRSAPVFVEEDGERRLLVESEGGFVLKDQGKRFTLDELMVLLESAPERFSPNVLLRPVVQDSLFPAVAYVGGPAEVSYFAQAAAFYDILQRPMPVIWPRSSFTVVSEDIRPTMQRYGLSLEDCFRGLDHVSRRALEARPSRIDALFADLRGHGEHDLEELRPALAAVDPSLGPAVDTIRRKLLHRIASLETKFVHYRMRQAGEMREEVQSLLNHCYPNGNLQERELGIYHLLASVGPSLLDTVYDSIDLNAFTHRIVTF